MAIYSSPFDSTVLTGEDAIAFMRQIQDETPNEAAQKTAEAGYRLLRRYRDRERTKQDGGSI